MSAGSAPLVSCRPPSAFGNKGTQESRLRPCTTPAVISIRPSRQLRLRATAFFKILQPASEADGNLGSGPSWGNPPQNALAARPSLAAPPLDRTITAAPNAKRTPVPGQFWFFCMDRNNAVYGGNCPARGQTWVADRADGPGNRAIVETGDMRPVPGRTSCILVGQETPGPALTIDSRVRCRLGRDHRGLTFQGDALFFVTQGSTSASNMAERP